ncbi:hypothetical protein ACHAXT_002801 [Thalassiosira profunda]
MRKRYPELGSEHEIKRALAEMAVDVFAPQTTAEDAAAEELGAFSHFVLREAREACLEILEGDLQRGGASVGELQGGSDDYSIYRVSFPTGDGDCNGDISGRGKGKNAAVQLLELYNQRNGRGRKHALTIDTIKHYMLGMCNRRTQERSCARYNRLGNLMFILQFGGPTEGQVRHIDNMVGNVQICLYMSANCPSTVVYEMDDGDGSPVTNGASLIEFWGQHRSVPELVREILSSSKHGDMPLKSKWYTRCFGWTTINQQLLCFGKLYQPVAYQLGLMAEPGTTLLAGGNEIHAGPPTTESRMFAFAIGIPKDDASENGDSVESEGGENDGEVQYSPVLFHIDFCCLVFSILDLEYAVLDSEHLIREAKRFLVEILLELIRDYPMREYLLQIDEDRVGIRSFLEKALARLENGQSMDCLIDEAVESDCILYSADVVKRRSKKKKARPKRNKEPH